MADSVLSIDFTYEEGANGPFRPVVRDVEVKSVTSKKSSYGVVLKSYANAELSDIRMLSDFGFVTVVDLAVSLVGVMLALPAVLVLAERGELTTLPAQAWRALRRGLARPRRARATA